jgi:polysaccharide biosynthesis protein PslH
MTNINSASDGSEREPWQSGRSGRPKLLFLAQTLPYPPDIGVNVRTFNILRLLARAFDITALCFFRRNERPLPRDVAESVTALSELARIEAFAIAQEHSRPRLLLDHLRSLATQQPYTRYAYASAAFERRLRELLRTERFDLVHVDSLDLSGYLPILAGLPIACTHHNVESMLLERRGQSEKGAAARWYIRQQAKWTENEERAWCPRVNLNLAVSNEDAATLRHIAPRARAIVVPNGVDTTLFEPDSSAESGVVFVGGHGWLPNREAMGFFAEKITPLIRARGVTPSVTWVGRAPEAVREAYARDYGFRLTGYVEDIRPFVNGAACFVVPLLTGGGTRLKILDAWAMGKAVVSTSVGCEGLAARDGENILIRDDPAAFADAVVAVLQDEDLRRRLGAGARVTATTVYDWEVIGRSLEREYLALLPATSVDEAAQSNFPQRSGR